MKINPDQKVGHVVAEDYRSADIFKKYGIDFWFGGSSTISEACQKKKLNQGAVLHELDSILCFSSESIPDFNKSSLHELIEVIINRHHKYVETNIPVIAQYLKMICAAHGQSHPELEEVMTQFLLSSKELSIHMEKEEQILFPFIRQMEVAKQWSKRIGKPELAGIIKEMLHDHENEGERFERIQEITNDFQFPRDASNNYKVAFHKLKEFQNDLHLHIHLENNILFPRAAQLEKELFLHTKITD